jgi:hypothetical protein
VKAGAQEQRAREIEVLTVDQLDRYLAAIPEARRVPLLLAGRDGSPQRWLEQALLK